jgi:hypothetical protein
MPRTTQPLIQAQPQRFDANQLAVLTVRRDHTVRIDEDRNAEFQIVGQQAVSLEVRIALSCAQNRSDLTDSFQNVVTTPRSASRSRRCVAMTTARRHCKADTPPNVKLPYTLQKVQIGLTVERSCVCA